MPEVTPGARVGSYEIVAPIGHGATGDVYRARDLRLNRTVAIKFLSEDVADPAARRRFQQEAQTASSLNHPHIVTVFEAGEWTGRQFLVTEFIDGGTLRDWARAETRSWRQIAELLIEVADGLAAAHGAGLLHRDVKPDNILVAKNGYAKLADFGLAKLAEPAESAVTRTVAAPTRRGVIVGTIAYMSPEQAAGKPLDARSDIFSFGVVLYEQLAGKRPFRAGSELELLKVIAHDAFEPLPEEVPLRLRLVVEKALEKDPADRYQTMRDLVVDLRRAARSTEGTGAGKSVSSTRPARRWVWGVGVFAFVGLSIAGWLMFRSGTRTQLPVRLTLTFEGLSGESDYLTPVPSPDGRNFVFVAVDGLGKRSLWVRPLSSETARALPGTEEADRPFWSPDGQWVGFHAQGKLRKVHISGGNPQTIAEVRTISGADAPAWGPKGDIIFAPGNRAPLFRIAESGGPPQPLTKLDASRSENSHRFPVFLPDGRHFLFLARCGQRENNALYLGSLDSGETKRLMPMQSNISYEPAHDGRGGSILYARDGTLVSQSFDGEKVTGEPATVVEGVAYRAASVAGAFAVSADGSLLVFRPATLGRTRLTWYDRSGTSVGFLGLPGDYAELRLSPDGSRLAYSRPDEQTGNRDVWYMETSRGVGARLTTHGANDWFPQWSPDGQRIVFASDREGGPDNRAYVKNSLEPGIGEVRLKDMLQTSFPQDWSHDGKWILIGTLGSSPDLWIVPAVESKSPFAFLATPFVDSEGRFSPDDKWIAYNSNESGRFEIYVRPFNGGPADPVPKIQVSTNGGYFPVWPHNSKELFFLGADLKLYTVNTADLSRANASPRPSALFTPCADTVVVSMPLPLSYYDYPYDITRDGRRILFNCLASKPNRFDVMLNWQTSR